VRVTRRHITPFIFFFFMMPLAMLMLFIRYDAAATAHATDIPCRFPELSARHFFRHRCRSIRRCFIFSADAPPRRLSALQQ